jgi:ubiquinone/menaquinone biosynthesis C-methylase UbiE
MTTKNKQGDLWGTAPEDWALYLETTFIPVYKKIINKSSFRHDARVLDIGCGSGLFIKMVNAKVPGITGIDLSDALLKIARERNPTATLLNQDMEHLPFPDKSFDLVTGFNSFQYASDIMGVLGEIRRVMKDDGKLVIGIWGSDTECEALKVLSSVASLLPEHDPESPGPLALSRDGKVEGLLLAAGYKITEHSTIECPWNFSTLENALRGILSAGPSAEAINYAGLDKVKEKLVQTLEPFNLYDEIYVLENVFHYYIASKVF